MSTRRALMLGMVTVGLATCGGSESTDGPPEILYGHETCARCGMVISDERHAAALVESNGNQLHFDDTGEMISIVQATGLDERKSWVHAYDTKMWLDGLVALYIIDPSRNTPMATGIVAFATRDSAAAFIAVSDGEIRTWSELLAMWTIE